MQYGRALGDGAAQSIRRAAEALWRATTQQSLVVFRLRLFGFVVVEPRSEISLNEIRDFDISMGPQSGILTFRWAILNIGNPSLF